MINLILYFLSKKFGISKNEKFSKINLIMILCIFIICAYYIVTSEVEGTMWISIILIWISIPVFIILTILNLVTYIFNSLNANNSKPVLKEKTKIFIIKPTVVLISFSVSLIFSILFGIFSKATLINLIGLFGFSYLLCSFIKFHYYNKSISFPITFLSIAFILCWYLISDALLLYDCYIGFFISIVISIFYKTILKKDNNKIPAYVFFALSVLIIAFSLFLAIDENTDEGSAAAFIVFFGIGCIFLVIGIAYLIVSKLAKNKKELNK